MFRTFFRSGGRLFADGAGAAAVLGLFPRRRRRRAVVAADRGADGRRPHPRRHHHRRRPHRQDGQAAAGGKGRRIRHQVRSRVLFS